MKKGLIITIILVLILGGVGYFVFTKMQEEVDNFDITPYIVEEECYETTDKKYQFFFVKEENTDLFNLIKERLNRELPSDYQMNTDIIKEFVYINKNLYIATYVETIGIYTRYVGFFAKSPLEQNDMVFILDDTEKTVIEKKEKTENKQNEVDEFKIMINRFNSDENSCLPYKGESGYYFFESKSYGPNYLVVYTTNFQKLGYISRDLTKLEEDEVGISLYDNSKLEGDTKKYNAIGKDVEEYSDVSTVTIDVRGEEYTIDYAKLEEDIIKKIEDKNYKIILKTCDCSKVRDEGYIDKAKCEEKELSIDVIKKVIKKLKRADKVEYKLTSKVCSKYNLYVDSPDTILNVFEADDITTLLVGFDEKGFAYHFTGENVEIFMKSLDE